MKQLLILFTLIVLSACAQSSDKIRAAYVSPLQYQDYSCKQIGLEIGRTSRRLNEVMGIQDETASNDSVAMGVGLILFWPALFFIESDDQKEEVARLKGEYEALERAAIEKECSIAPELEEARRLRAQYEAEKKAKNEQYRKDLN